MESSCSPIRLFVFLLKNAKDGREVCALHHIHVYNVKNSLAVYIWKQFMTNKNPPVVMCQLIC